MEVAVGAQERQPAKLAVAVDDLPEIDEPYVVAASRVLLDPGVVASPEPIRLRDSARTGVK